jgi:Cu2+-exporting ATPase
VTGADSTATCTLCDLPVSRSRVENERGEAFCCPGCRNVHARLDDVEAVEAGDVRATLDDEAERRDSGPPAGHERAFLRVTGMHCTTCEAFLESVAGRTDGIEGAEASYVTDTVRVDYDPEALSEEGVAAALSTTGYTATRRADASAVERAEEDTRWRLAAGILMGMMVMLPYLLLIYPLHFSILYDAWMREMLREMLTGQAAQYPFLFIAFFAGLVLVTTGGPILRGAYVSLRTGAPNMDLLVALAAVSAYAYSTVAVFLGRLDIYYDITVVIVLVVTAGRYYESTLKRRATERLSEVAITQVDEARLYQDGTTATVSVSDLDEGDRVLVRAGERVPVDGVVRDGECTVDEGIVTGESIPVVKGEGEQMIGGSVLRSGVSVVEVTDGGRSSIDRLVNLVYDIQSANHGVQKFVDRLAAVFVPLVVLVAALAGGAYLAFGAGVSTATVIALTVLLVSCPCALGLATPMAVASGIRTALERGIVVFDESVFERLRGVDVVVFDKTGTLTTGELDVHEVDAPEGLLRQVVALERRASHPAAEAIVR